MIQKINDGCLLFCDGCDLQMPVYDELYAVFQWYWHDDPGGLHIRETAMNSN
jgi:hypothetical protein